MINQTILISGAGIAGPTLAFWLKQYGFIPTVVERSPLLREGGYAIDVRGAAIDVAAKMKILPRLKQERLNKGKISFVDQHHQPQASFNSGALQEIAAGLWVEIMRTDLGKIIYDATANDIEYIFDDTIQSLTQGEAAVEVSFKKSPPRKFDLVIGADGLHSVVRKLVFGEEQFFEKPLGYYVAIFSVDNYLQLDQSTSGYIYNMPGKMTAALNYTTEADNRTVAFFIFKQKHGITFDAFDVAQQQQLVLDAFSNEGWEIPVLLKKMKAAPDFYFDVVSQIRMDK